MEDKLLNTTGKRIRILRQDLRWNQGDLVEAMNRRGMPLSRAYMSKLENSDRSPSADVLAALAQVLGTTTDYLMLLTDDPSMPENAVTEDRVVYEVSSLEEHKLFQQLLDLFGALPDADRRFVVNLADHLRRARSGRVVGDG